ncbi:MAG: putative cytokinetic ring protein SteA [Actinomycetota bacterium]
MALRLLRRAPASAKRSSTKGRIEGTARLDRRTKRLIGRLEPGNIAIIDHEELDRIAAESLLEHGVGAVVNARSSVSARYPNLGPLVLATAGIPILDNVGADVFTRIREGQRVRLDGQTLFAGKEAIATGTLLSEADIRESMDAAHAKLSETVERFAENTLDYVRREQDILLTAITTPDLKARIKGRHALVVTRGYHYKEDLDALRSYIREMRPVIIAVDGAADACLARGMRPDIILGDMDSVSTQALRCGAELVVHAYPNGSSPGLPTIEALGLSADVLTAPGTSEDVAMLLAHERGAELIVAVGSHNSLVEFLDKGRQGMASTFLARLRIGPRLVDAKGVSQLYRTRISARLVLLLPIAVLITGVIMSAISEPLRLYWSSVWEVVRDTWFRIQQLF